VSPQCGDERLGSCRSSGASLRNIDRTPPS
jgi:hypothetical protein